jgi:hypothetical protein
MASDPPKVFISYSHDSPGHCDWVLDLAQQLRRDGIDAELDQFHQSERCKNCRRVQSNQNSANGTASPRANANQKELPDEGLSWRGDQSIPASRAANY